MSEELRLIPQKHRSSVIVAVVAAAFGITSCTVPDDSPQDPPGPSTPATKSRQDVIKAGAPLTTRVETTTCAGYRSGTGFVVGTHLIATVADVVDGGQTVSVRGVRVSEATVIGLDDDRQVALLRTKDPVTTGPFLKFSEAEPAEGDEVISISYPNGRPQTPVNGTVNGLNRSLDVEGKRLENLIQYNAGASAASSGGPVLNLTGEVVGMTEGRYGDSGEVGYAISTKTARGLVQAWEAAPTVIKPPSCKSRPKTVVILDGDHPDGPGLAYFVRSHFDGLNVGDGTMKTGASEGVPGYDASFNVLSGQLKEQLGPVDRFRSGRRDAKNRKVVLSNIVKIDDVEDTVDIHFDRLTDKGESKKCGRYTYRYTARLAAGVWTLDSRIPLRKNPTSC